LVYPVDGGMEDWSYAAGWEASPMPITVCKPRTYGGYASSRTMYKSGSIASLVYLAEMDDDKTPRSSTLGHTRELVLPSESDGHVARNIRMCLKMIELTRPEIVVTAASLPARLPVAGGVSIEARGFGCMTFSARLLFVPRVALQASASCLLEPLSWGGTDIGRARLLAAAHEVAAVSNAPCGGLSAWEHPEVGGKSFRGVAPNVDGEFCVVFAAEFDQDWGQQLRPDPNLKPRSHAVRSRVEEHYTASASDGPMMIDEYKTKLFPVLAAPIIISKSETAVPSSTATSGVDAGPSVATSPSATLPPGADTGEIIVAEEEAESGVATHKPLARPATAGTAVAAAPTSGGGGIGLPLPSSLTVEEPSGFAGGLSAIFVAVSAVLAACNCVSIHRRCISSRHRSRLPPPVPRTLEPEESSAMEQGDHRTTPGPAE